MPKDPLTRPKQSTHVPGQLIIRFKKGVVQDLASTPVARSARTAAVAASMPDDVTGPLDLLGQEAGLKAMRPLFVKEPEPAPAPGVMALSAVRRSLARSASAAPRESLQGFQIIDVKDKKVSSALMKRLRASKAIDIVEPVPNRWLSAKPDPFINRQWGLRAIRWFDGTRPGAGRVHVAVIDSGVDDKHEDLHDAIEEYRHDGNTARDVLGHGSHVGGIIAAITNNAVGISGVANCRLHCWKVFDDRPPRTVDENFNFEFYSAALASGLDSNIKVMNLSIGGTDSSQAEAAVFAELRDDGVVVVAAMGNEFEEGNPKEFPAAYKGVLAVGAVDEVGRRAAFSCTGAHIGLVAPGVNILSTVPQRKAMFADRTMYDSWPGTSMATPYVAGTAALLYAGREKSKAAANAIVKRLTSTAKKLPEMRNRPFTRQHGSGLLDVTAALRNS